MLSNNEFVRQSLELNLFFMRIAKEHSIFLEAGFTPRDQQFIEQSEMLKNIFSQLLVETINMSDGIISPEVANSGELVTDLTLAAERETQFYTNIKIDPNITRMEAALAESSPGNITMNTVRMVEDLNNRAIRAAQQIAGFKSNLLQNVLSCRMFTTNYPLLIDHILREAKFYLRMLTMLQKREEFDIAREAAYQETFWNRIMAEHSKFIRGLLDPTEEKLFDTANDFGKKFDELTLEAKNLSKDMGLLPEVTDRSLKNTVDIRNFKRQGTEGLIQCQIRSIAFPLLGDHVVREANHYIRMLKDFKKGKVE
ncbi:DUF2935 domain-containing protein [Clostridium sp. YIM B02515]|uniref:DUF2935 domain-containing protein n=1 Tax=Clostridium rhizosphaerae TaxID=2803861 RepID=A0ABS1T5D7_9CLOT|nr:DUF2935 domain-containing protein [Clostridium rhizosphaerae]MBL4934547.1 DUF2935 domain-containing protein [Clostridium rhizosphaerae]